MPPKQGVKRKVREDSSDGLIGDERVIYNIIKSKKDEGILDKDLKRELEPSQVAKSSLTKSLKSLVAKNMIKGFKSVQTKGFTHYYGAEFKPSKQVTGGVFYDKETGDLDREYIENMKLACKSIISKQKVVATLEAIADSIRITRISKEELTKEEVEQLVNDLVHEKEVEKVTSNGIGEFANIPVGKVCYKSLSRGNAVAAASIPCGVCPNISVCDPDGVVSPKTCVYYKAWLDF